MARKMKDSGIEWIGEIPEEWEVGQIGQLYSERRTKVSDKDYPPLSVTMKGILPQLSTAAKTDAHDDRKLVCKGDFAINSRSDRRGSCGISEQDGSISLINTVLQPRGEMNPGYYNWLFHTSMFADEFYKWGHGIVDDLWTTGWSDMKKIGVPVPSKCEQKQLAEHLNFECSNIDTILSKTRSSIEEYKKLKQAVITQAVATQQCSHIKLKYLMNVIVDCPHETPTYSFTGNYYVIRTADQSLAFLRRDEDMYRLDASEYKKRTRRLTLDKDDIVYGREGERWGLACIVPKSNKYCLGQRIMQFRCNTKFLYPKYAMYVLNSEPVYLQGVADTIGSTSPHVNISTICNYLLPVPALTEQKEIADYLDAKCAEIDRLIAKKEQLVKELESYKKSLIYEVVTGKREV